MCIKWCNFSRLEILLIRDSFRLKYLFLSNLAEYLFNMVFKITDLRYNCGIHVTRSAFKVIDLLIHFFKAFSVISGVFCKTILLFFKEIDNFFFKQCQLLLTFLLRNTRKIMRFSFFWDRFLSWFFKSSDNLFLR